jgi:GntR family transcriptional regulator, transcriptional repressor for pyruvate dehydrogenase complex
MVRRKHSLIFETIMEHIKTQLLTNNLKPGDRLPTVAALAEELDVGLASVREAYRVLEVMGILEVCQGRGTTVSSRILEPIRLKGSMELAEQQSVTNVLEARKVLEPGAAALAALRSTSAESDAILRSAEEMEQLYLDGKDFIDPDIRFHEQIFLATHNPVLARPLLEIHEYMLDVRRLAIRVPEIIEKSVHFHKLIAYAIKEGNANLAQSLMQQHLEDAEQMYARHLPKVANNS